MFDFPVYVPLPIVPAKEIASLQQRVDRLERALVQSMDVMQALLIKLEQRLGADFLGVDLAQWKDTSPPAAQVRCLEEIEELVQAGAAPKAARLFRDTYGVTWDQAHEAIGEWHKHSHQQHLRWLRLTHCLRVLERPQT